MLPNIVSHLRDSQFVGAPLGLDLHYWPREEQSDPRNPGLLTHCEARKSFQLSLPPHSGLGPDVSLCRQSPPMH